IWLAPRWIILNFISSMTSSGGLANYFDSHMLGTVQKVQVWGQPLVATIVIERRESEFTPQLLSKYFFIGTPSQFGRGRLARSVLLRLLGVTTNCPFFTKARPAI